MASATATTMTTTTVTATASMTVTETSAHLENAKKAYGDAHAHDAHSPGYPPSAIQSLLEKGGLENRAQSRIVEIGAGTGKCTEALSARDELFEIVAVEPMPMNRGVLDQKRLRGVVARDGTAERMSIPSWFADGVFCAQTFHWFPNEHALREIHRILKPGAKLLLLWNIPDHAQPKDWKATSKWEQLLKDRILKLEGDGPPDFSHNSWTEVFEKQTLFTAVETKVMAWAVHMSKGSLWERIKTISRVAALEEKALEEFKALYDSAVVKENGSFNDKEEVAVNYVTYMAWAEAKH